MTRRIVFEKVGLTGRAAVEGGEKEKEVGVLHAVTSVPVYAMTMRVKVGE